MQSTLILFVQKYQASKLSDISLRVLWKKNINKEDFDRNEEECWRWFLRTKKECQKSLTQQGQKNAYFSRMPQVRR